MNVVYPVLIYYLIFSACVIKGSCDSCRNKPVDITFQLRKLNKVGLENIHHMGIRTDAFNAGPTILVHRFAEDNFKNIRYIDATDNNGILDNLLLLSVTDIDLEGKESIRYVVYSKNSYDTATNSTGGEEKNVTFKAINFFVPSGQNDGKYVLSSDDDVAELFSKLYNKNKNSTLIKIDKDVKVYITSFNGEKGEEKGEFILSDVIKTKEKVKIKTKKGVESFTGIVDDGGKITVSISEQLLDQRKK